MDKKALRHKKNVHSKTIVLKNTVTLRRTNLETR